MNRIKNTVFNALASDKIFYSHVVLLSFSCKTGTREAFTQFSIDAGVENPSTNFRNGSVYL